MSTETENPQHSEILSQDETDALLQGIDDGIVQTAAGKSTNGEVILYDFSDCDRLIRGAMPTLQIINTRIARCLRDSLTEFMRQPIEVEAEGNFARRFGDHMPTLPMQACLNLVRVSPLPGTMLVIPDTRLVYMTVDCFFGGKGKVAENPPVREFTHVENRMVLLLLERVFAAIRDGWESVIAIEPELIGQEQDPRFAAITSKRDPVIITDFVISMADEQLKLQLIMPRAQLEPVEDLLDAAPRKDEDDDNTHWNLAMRSRLEETRIGLQSALTRTTLRLGDVLSLQPGDVIPVDLPEQVIVEAAGTSLFSARIGKSRNRNAVEIIGKTDTNYPSIKN